MKPSELKNIVEAILFAADKPLSIVQLNDYFEPHDQVSRQAITEAIGKLQNDYKKRGLELIEVAKGFRFQTKQHYSTWVSKQWDEKTKKYSRALLETLAIIAYRQPVTRAEIEDIRGVSVSSNIIKTLEERNWVRTVGHKEVPGRPSMLGTTREFLDYFNLKTLDQLPALSDIIELDKLNLNLDLLKAENQTGQHEHQ